MATPRPSDVKSDSRRSFAWVYWAIGLLSLAWVGIGATCLGALLKSSSGYWCPALPTPAWVWLYEIGEIGAVLATLAASAPIMLLAEFHITSRHTRRTLIAVECLTVAACVLFGILWSDVIPSASSCP